MPTLEIDGSQRHAFVLFRKPGFSSVFVDIRPASPLDTMKTLQIVYRTQGYQVLDVHFVEAIERR